MWDGQELSKAGIRYNGEKNKNSKREFEDNQEYM